jgi:hypothetical protein
MPGLSSPPDDCTETIYDSRLKVEENGRKAVFLNLERKEVRKVQVDGCLITGSSRRADYIVSRPGVVDVVVELKGKDIYHARDQIQATLPIWQSHPPFSDKIGALIVGSRIPASASDLQVMVAQFRRAGLVLIVEKSGKRGYKFEDFIG